MIVILSTLNGEQRLREMLESLCRANLPKGVRFHIVDNGSTDGTFAMIESFCNRLPITLYSQPLRGKNNCLNLVIESVSKGLAPDELVVFTDDDILPGSDWLNELQSAGDAHPDRDVFAGRILPHWPAADLEHLEPVRQHFGVLFTLTSHREGPVECALAWGPNMAVRAKIFQAGYRFDPRFGPNGTAGYPMGSETELMERLDKAGHRAWFAERASVRHQIRPSQLEAACVVQRAFRHGYGAGWREQRRGGLWRLLTCQWVAFRGIVAAQIRKTVSSRSRHILHDYHEAWARGLSSGSLFGYQAARRQAEAAAHAQYLDADAEAEAKLTL